MALNEVTTLGGMLRTDCVVVGMCMWVIGVGNEGALVCMYSITGLLMHVQCGIVCQFIIRFCVSILLLVLIAFGCCFLSMVSSFIWMWVLMWVLCRSLYGSLGNIG